MGLVAGWGNNHGGGITGSYWHNISRRRDRWGSEGRGLRTAGRESGDGQMGSVPEQQYRGPDRVQELCWQTRSELQRLLYRRGRRHPPPVGRGPEETVECCAIACGEGR